MNIWIIILYALGVVCFVFISIYFVTRTCVKQGIASPNTVFHLINWAVVSGFIGARLEYVLIQHSIYVHSSEQIFVLWKGGYSSMGAVIAGSAIGILLLKKKNIPVFRFFDIITPYIALSIFFTRVGGFIRGSSFGKVTNLPWGVIYPRGSLAFKAQVSSNIISPDASHALPVHPTTLYEAAGAVIAFFIVVYASRHKHTEGTVMWTLLLVYSMERFVIDYFRGDMMPDVFSIFTPSQMISLIIALYAAYSLV